MAGADTSLRPQMERDGLPLPDNVANQPRLAQNLIGYLDAFYDLDSERHHGAGFMRIPWSKVVLYAEHYGMNENETLFFIRKMDDAHLENLASKSPKTDGKGSASTGTVVQRPPRPD